MEPENCIRSDALTGLRGLASLHILVFHAFYFSRLHALIVGSLEMPLFFLLSGYSLALSYGRTTYDSYTSCCCAKTSQTPQSEEQTLLKSFDFYRNRFARVMPMYYLANFVLALPLLAFGHGIVTLADDLFVLKLISHVIDSLAPIGMIFPSLLWPLVGAGWTISTLWCFYLFFPILLPRFQRYTEEKASHWIIMLFWLQLVVGLVPGIVLYFKPVPLPKPIFEAYWVSTGWGVSRLPVFLMGIHAGLLRLRHHNSPNVRYRNVVANLINAWFPWKSTCGNHVIADEQDGALVTQRRWAKLVDATSASHVVFIIIFALLHSLVDPMFGGGANWVFQLIGVHSLLTVIDGLTRDGANSLLSKICNFRLIQELGRISMTLYLIHMPLMDWLCVAVKGNLNGEAPVVDRNIIPVWGIPVVVIVCPLVAWVLTKYIEEPMRTKLRVRTATS